MLEGHKHSVHSRTISTSLSTFMNHLEMGLAWDFLLFTRREMSCRFPKVLDIEDGRARSQGQTARVSSAAAGGHSPKWAEPQALEA